MKQGRGIAPLPFSAHMHIRHTCFEPNNIFLLRYNAVSMPLLGDFDPFLIFLIPLALLILFAAAVGVAILGIVEFVMLYHTAKLFRGFVQDDTKL